MKVYAVKDKRINHYKPPMFFNHLAECTRTMEQIVNNPESDLYKWPMDYQLDQLGEFDPKLGTFVHDQKEICQIMDLKKEESRPTIDPVADLRHAKATTIEQLRQ